MLFLSSFSLHGRYQIGLYYTKKSLLVALSEAFQTIVEGQVKMQGTFAAQISSLLFLIGFYLAVRGEEYDGDNFQDLDKSELLNKEDAHDIALTINGSAIAPESVSLGSPQESIDFEFYYYEKFSKDPQIEKLLASYDEAHVSVQGILLDIHRFIYYCHLIREFGHIPWTIAKIPEGLLVASIERTIKAYERGNNPSIGTANAVGVVHGFLEEYFGKDSLLVKKAGESADVLKYFTQLIVRKDLRKDEKIDILIYMLAGLQVPDAYLPSSWPESSLS